MRVLHAVLSGRMAGGQKVCLDLIEDQLKRGYQVMLSSTSEGPMIEACPDAVNVVFHPVVRVSRPFVLWELVCFLRKAQPDLIHTHVTVSGNILWRIAGWLAGVPVINHIHSGNYYRPNSISGRIARLLDNFTARIPRLFISVSAAAAAGLRKQGYPQNRIVVVPNGVAIREQKINQSSVQEPPVIGCVARLCESKGQELLIRAFAKLSKRHSQVRLWLVGEDQENDGGRYQEYLKNLAHELGVEEKTVFWGHRDDVREMMRKMYLLVLPSRDEGLPLVLLEAMAEGIPVVATKVGGVAELVDNGQNGVLIPSGDVRSLEEGLTRLIENKELARDMGQTGREKILRKFSLENQLNAIHILYQQIVSGQ